MSSTASDDANRTSSLKTLRLIRPEAEGSFSKSLKKLNLATLDLTLRLEIPQPFRVVEDGVNQSEYWDVSPPVSSTRSVVEKQTSTFGGSWRQRTPLPGYFESSVEETLKILPTTEPGSHAFASTSSLWPPLATSSNPPLYEQSLGRQDNSRAGLPMPQYYDLWSQFDLPSQYEYPLQLTTSQNTNKDGDSIGFLQHLASLGIGRTVFTVQQFVDQIEHQGPNQDERILQIDTRKMLWTIVAHAFLVLKVALRGGQTLYMRVDRLPQRGLSKNMLLFRPSTVVANTTVAISSTLDQLQGGNESAIEALIDYEDTGSGPRPSPTLYDFAVLLGLFEQNLPLYDLRKENCWFYANAIQEAMLALFGDRVVNSGGSIWRAQFGDSVREKVVSEMLEKRHQDVLLSPIGETVLPSAGVDAPPEHSGSMTTTMQASKDGSLADDRAPKLRSFGARAITLFDGGIAGPPALLDCLKATMELHGRCVDIEVSDPHYAIAWRAYRILLSSCCRLVLEWREAQNMQAKPSNSIAREIGSLYETIVDVIALLPSKTSDVDDGLGTEEFPIDETEIKGEVDRLENVLRTTPELDISNNDSWEEMLKGIQSRESKGKTRAVEQASNVATDVDEMNLSDKEEDEENY